MKVQVKADIISRYVLEDTIIALNELKINCTGENLSIYVGKDWRKYKDRHLCHPMTIISVPMAPEEAVEWWLRLKRWILDTVSYTSDNTRLRLVFDCEQDVVDYFGVICRTRDYFYTNTFSNRRKADPPLFRDLLIEWWKLFKRKYRYDHKKYAPYEKRGILYSRLRRSRKMFEAFVKETEVMVDCLLNDKVSSHRYTDMFVRHFKKKHPQWRTKFATKVHSPTVIEFDVIGSAKYHLHPEVDEAVKYHMDMMVGVSKGVREMMPIRDGLRMVKKTAYSRNTAIYKSNGRVTDQFVIRSKVRAARYAELEKMRSCT